MKASATTCLAGAFFCLMAFASTIAQSRFGQNSLIFDRINVTNGLSQSWVTTINQDEDGFMWFGTRDGLNRYDSRNFVVHRSVEEDSTTLNSSHISSIFMDSKKRMWVGTAAGLNLYDKDQDCFRRIPDPSQLCASGKIYLSKILEDSQGSIWFTSDKGLHHFNPQRDKQSELLLSLSDFNDASITQMKGLALDQNNTFWLGTNQGIVKLDLRKGKKLLVWALIKLPTTGKEEFGVINDILEYPKGTLWLATERGGFFKLETKNLSFTNFSQKSTQGRLVCDNIRKLMLDQEKQKLWIGTRNGLCIFDLKTSHFESHQNKYNDPATLSENSVHSIFKDKVGSFWIGTYHGGINICDNSFFKITTYKQGEASKGLNHSAIGAINEIESGQILIGTEGGGINFYDRSSGVYHYYQSNPNDKNGLNHNNVKCMLKDQDGKFWIGTSGGGICSFDPLRKQFKHFSQQEIGIKNNGDWVYSIAMDQRGVLWIGNFREGLVSYDPKSKQYTLLKASGEGSSLVSNLIRKILVDSKNRIWIGTDDGLSLYYPETGRFRSFLKNPAKKGSLSSNSVFSIYEDSQQQVWIGTLEGGLNKFNESTSSFEVFNTSHGLPGNNIFGILEDKQGILWLSTNCGISKFNPGSRSFKNYSTQDGLLDLEFSYNAYFKSADGTLFFGGRNGLIAFHPESIQENKTLPAALITDIKLFNKPLKIGDAHHILDKQIAETREIVLNHRQNVFSIGFSVLNYIRPAKNKYAYRLDGFENEWNYVNNPSATYTNLKPGTYTFLAKGTNNDNYWNENPVQLKIKVLPAPWKTAWAYTLYIILILGSIFILVRYQRIKASLEHNLEIKKLENQRQKELNQAKLRFFTDISHEIRTPLTLILTPLENLMAEYRGDTHLYKQLIGIKNHSDRLLRLANQLLDFRKKESGEIQLRAAEGNIVRFLTEIFLAFQEQAKRKNVALYFYPLESEIRVFYDRDELEKVFFNLIHNALKYTPAGGKVEIIVDAGTLEQEYGPALPVVKIEIRDNGIGVNANDLEKIFERYYGSSTQRSKLSTGIGLSLSRTIVKAHRGQITCSSQVAKPGEQNCTVFTVCLPLGKGHLKTSEIIEHFKNSENIDSYHDLLEQFDNSAFALFSDEIPASLQRHTLLVAEDNEEIRAFIVHHLSPEYNIIEASDGEEALALIHDVLPDLLITDIIMPKMDGLQLCNLLKKDEKTSHIPVIMLTARTALVHQVDGLESGADEFITKPFNLQLMKAKIKNLIKAQETMRKKFSQSFTLQPENVELGSSDAKFLSRVKALMEQHISNPDFNVDRFLKEIGMSRPVLYRKIKKLTNMSVIELLISYRLEKAAELLKNGHFNTSETAMQVGFSDPKYFSKTFRKKFGLSPSHFAKQEAAISQLEC